MVEEKSLSLCGAAMELGLLGKSALGICSAFAFLNVKKKKGKIKSSSRHCEQQRMPVFEAM